MVRYQPSPPYDRLSRNVDIAREPRLTPLTGWILNQWSRRVTPPESLGGLQTRRVNTSRIQTCASVPTRLFVNPCLTYNFGVT